MSWGTELWDQYDQIAVHTQKGIDFLEKYGHFVDARCKIEQEYATKLRRLVRNYLPKKKDEEDYQFTATKAFKVMLNEINDLAGQHEVIAENLSTAVVADLTSLVKSLKDDRRKYLQEGARIQAQLTLSLTTLAKTKDKYEKAFGASERALEAYNKADADLNLSRADVEKQRMNSNIKRQQADDAKNEYANQLQKANDYQSQFYNLLMPSVFQSLQDMDENRIKCIQNFLRKSAQTEQDVIPIVSQCLQGIQKSADTIDEKEDSQLVIEKYKSGFLSPTDIPFEDLSSSEHSNVNSSINNINDKKTILGTITGGKIKKRSGILGLFGQNKIILNGFNSQEDFSELPPNQRRKKLQAKIDDLTGKISQETAARDGLMKMKTVYEANPALGDPMSIEGQLTENGHRLDKLRSDLKRYQTFLEEVDVVRGGGPSSPASTLSTRTNGTTGGSSPRRSSVSDEVESLSRSASDSSVNHSKNMMATSIHSQGVVTKGEGEPSAPKGAPAPSPSSASTKGPAPDPSTAEAAALNVGDIKKVTCRLVSPLAKNKEGETSQSSLSSRSSNSPESGLGNSHLSLQGGGCQNFQDIDADEEEFYESEPLPILGRCRALYTFEASSEGSIPMEEGEDLWLIETDQGDGWTRVRRLNPSHLDPMPEGFVPTSYIDTTEMFPVPQPV
jgi:hypothetical protein